MATVNILLYILFQIFSLYINTHFIKMEADWPWPWPGGAVGCVVIPHAESLQVQSPVRAHAQAAGLVPGRDVFGSQPIDVSLSLSPSLFLPLSLL